MVDRNRLAKLLGMMGSDHDGEVVNAARQADRLVRRSGQTWEQIVVPPPVFSSSQPGRPVQMDQRQVNRSVDRLGVWMLISSTAPLWISIIPAILYGLWIAVLVLGVIVVFLVNEVEQDPSLLWMTTPLVIWIGVKLLRRYIRWYKIATRVVVNSPYQEHWRRARRDHREGD